MAQAALLERDHSVAAAQRDRGVALVVRRAIDRAGAPERRGAHQLPPVAPPPRPRVELHVAPEHALHVAVLARPGLRRVRALHTRAGQERVPRDRQPVAPGREGLAGPDRVAHDPGHRRGEAGAVGLADQVPARAPKPARPEDQVRLLVRREVVDVPVQRRLDHRLE